MATDRLTSTRQLNRASACRECLEHAQYGSFLRSGSERSERNRCYDWILCGLSIRRHVLKASTPYGGVSCRRRYSNTPQKFMPKLKDLSTIDQEFLKPSISQIMLKHIVKYLHWNSTNMCSCVKRHTNCQRISNACSKYLCI